MREDGGETLRRCQRQATTAAAPAGTLPNSDDILWEIFLRLPLQPSSVPRVSLVCKRWRCLAADRDFLLRFCSRHRKASLLGLFKEYGGWVTFTPLLEPPDRIPPERFSMRIDYGGIEANTNPYHGTLLGCRHGRVLVLDPRCRDILVCDPITGDQCRIALPPEYRAPGIAKGAVICADRDERHVHGGCHSSPFKVVLLQILCGGRACARVYSSDIGKWGHLISARKQCSNTFVYFYPPSIVVSNSLYWCSSNNVNMEILEFDIGRQRLSVIDGPSMQKIDIFSRQIIQGEDGGVGIAMLSYHNLQIWDGNFAGEIVTWVLRKTVNLELVLNMRAAETEIVGYVEDDDEILIKFDNNVFIVQLGSTQSKKLFESIVAHRYHSFTSFYSSGVFGRCRGLTSTPSTAAPAIPSTEQES